MANFKPVEMIGYTVNVKNAKMIADIAKAADEAGKFSFTVPQGRIIETEGEKFQVKLDNGSVLWLPFADVEIVYEDDEEDGDEW